MKVQKNTCAKAVFAAAALWLFSMNVAWAVPLVEEGFDYPLIATIDGTQTGGTGFDAGSHWGTSNAGISNGLTVVGLSTAGANAFKWTADGRHQRALASAIGGSTFYLSMLINNNANSTRFGVEVPGTSGPCFGRVTGGWGFFGGVNGTLGISNSGGSYQTWLGVPSTPDNLTHLLVFKFDYAANAINLYVDPLPAIGEPAPSATLVTGGNWTVALSSATWSAIATFFQGGTAAASLDEVRIGTTWADVAPADPVVTTTDAWWTNVLAGAGSSWGDSNNWVNTAGVNVLPGPGSAFLTVGGVSFTALYDSVQPAISNLTVENIIPYRTDLTISAPLTSRGGAAIRLKAGSRVTVAPGGVWSYEGVNGTTDKEESMLSVRNGGELNVSGGVIAFTNLPLASTAYGNYLNVGYQSTGSLTVTSGRLEYYERVPREFTNDFRSLRIGRGSGGNGTMELSGGSVLLGMNAGGGEMVSVGVGSGAPVGSTRGTVIVSGGDMVYTNNPGTGWNLVKIGGNYGIGTFIVTNTGYVNLKAGGVSSRLYVGTTPYGTGTLRLDGGYMTVGDGATVGYANGYSPPVWATGVVSVTAGTLDTGAGFVLGYGEQGTATGIGEATITGGRLVESFWGVFVGRSRTGGKGIGTLTITNGLLDIVSSADVEATGSAPGNGAYSGFAIGVINYNEANASSSARGEVTVSGSAVITNAGVLVIGVNGATGTLVQTGGTIRHVPTGAASRKFTAVGYSYGTSAILGGGNGTYDLSGGSYTTPNPVYVGGVPTNILSYALGGSVGLLKVSGGTFTANSTMMVGGYGTGTLTVGASGVCSVQNLVLTNNTACTLRCELGADGLGALSVSGTLTVSAGAKLEVDSTAYEGSAVWIKLVDCATRTGSFDPADITLTGQGEVKQNRNGDQDIWLYLQRGTLIGVQ